MANWNIKKKNGQNVMFNDNPRTRTKENYTQNNFIEQNTTVNGIPTNIPGYIIGEYDVIEHRIVDDTQERNEEFIKSEQRKERILMLIFLIFLPPMFIFMVILKLCGILSYK